ncbi:MAG: Holliday junction resolvase RuvX [Proteobacteria bacterium]|nr:Holliday junction resolvase RuvX [Pseudomonadota bacterium]
MRILCLDIGSKRIGLAASDPMGLIAQGIGVIERRGGGRDFDEIMRHARELEATLILVGLPLDEEGGIGPQAAKVEAFTARLKGAMEAAGLDTPVEMWDERFSTATAEQRLIEADVSRKRRREVIDKMAAVAILQDYLDSRGDRLEGGEGFLG